MIFPKAYSSLKEDEIYATWETSGFFNPDIPHSTTYPPASPCKAWRAGNLQPTTYFSISMPPPNATGELHIGHAMFLTLQDIMIRYHRMKGFATLWLPGTDHAAIATQNKVEKNLAKEGITRQSLGRESFLKKVNEFVEQSQVTMRTQIRKMGSSCDWSRERYTMDEHCTKAVNEMFVRMYEDELIYRGNRIVHWCPRCMSTLSDDEVNYKEIPGSLYHINYSIKGEQSTLAVATTRPETMLGDVAIAVNPHDARYFGYIGKVAILPLSNREIPIIADDYVDAEFGTGVLKITPAHDPNDFALGNKYGLPILRVIGEDGRITLTDLAPENNDLTAIQQYEGLDRSEARERIVADLMKQGFLQTVEERPHAVGFCYRCDTLIEPLLSLQWFVDVNKVSEKHGKSLKQLAHDAVNSKEITIIPSRFEKIYFNWINNLRDWCISRQIWFGHRIPAYYCITNTGGCGTTIVAREKPESCPKCSNTHIVQDEDTFDTWFSSGLWTFSTLGWPDNAQLEKGVSIKRGDLLRFHPTSVLETGEDILFFWVARMIMMSQYALLEVPFHKVYIHGLVLDKDGKKMSKSREETAVDPLEVINTYGADALRLTMITGVTPGNAVRLTDEKIAGSRNFVNKLWNVSRYILQSTTVDAEGSDHQPTLADRWIASTFNACIERTSLHIERLEFSQAAECLRSFTADDLADWYLGIAKIEGGKDRQLRAILETLITLWHPFLPFVTEEIYRHFAHSPKNPLLITHPWPEYQRENDGNAVIDFTLVKSIIHGIRNVRTEYRIPPAQKLRAVFYAPYRASLIREQETLLMRLARLEQITLMEAGEKPEGSIYLKFQDIEIFLKTEKIDSSDEIERLTREMKNFEQLIITTSERLTDKAFIAKAPSRIIESERAKIIEYQDKVVKLREQISHLS